MHVVGGIEWIEISNAEKRMEMIRKEKKVT